MCDELTEKAIDEYQKRSGQLSRRDFGKLSVAAGLSSVLGANADAGSSRLTESDVTIKTPDGEADCYFVHPAEGQHPGVLIWPDILGLRPAFRAMAERLAQSGYSVLVVNPFYRMARAPVAPDGATFRDPAIRELVLPMARALNADTSVTDATAFIAFLDEQPGVDTDKKLGTAGYCMGGPLIMRTAAAVPERVGAAASFHGGGLVTDGPDSPHLLIPQSPAHVLHAIAASDHEQNPQTRDTLIAAYAAVQRPAEIEVYKDTLHGWCPIDSAVYNEDQAERAWARLLALFDSALV